jgi:histidinol-phosphate aminotransferase
MATMTATAPAAPAHVRELARYVPGKSSEEVARDLNLDPKSIVKLASNENPRGPSPRVLAAIAQAASEVTRYPDGNAFALKAALSERLGVAPSQIVLGNGSNDVLELVTQAYLRAGDETVYAQHAFAVYPLATQARGGVGIEVPARDFGHDLPQMRAAITPRTRIVFVANPNNPTGTFVARAELEAFVASVPRDVLVVLDEAYNEYLEPAERCDSVGWLSRYPNLVLSRTFSKAHGLAALRIGYGIMHADVADMLNRVRQPFNVNALAQAAALAALADGDYVDASRALNRAGIRQLGDGLAALGVMSLPSHGNFVLAKVGDAQKVNQALLAQGVIVRPVANYGLPEWLRVSVGLPSENERFLAALASALGR